ncbi:hypothetical protein F5Y16DRAFT_420772 [Xylariaceae sp. FL0255]|nr:hypothetical protein F5Y16DRAFT_420772 [Xylariaceae sp. FL0255]
MYRLSDDLQEVDAVLGVWIFPFGCVIAGDFNAGDSLWDRDNPNYYGGAAFAGIMHDYGLDLISEPNVATYDDSNVLDLAFSNVPMADGQISEALYFTSDHETLRIVVPINKDLGCCPKSTKWTVPDDRLPEFMSIVKDRIYEFLSIGSNTEDLDRFA